jgi:hypothetical protein
MNQSPRELQPGQFGLWALFVLMTLVAVGFAIIRLPFPVMIKLLCLITLWACFQTWITQKRRLSRRDRINAAVVEFVGSIVIQAPYLWIFFQPGPTGRYSEFGIICGVLLIVIITLGAARAARRLKKELRPDSERA